jgi:hypothetical protein
MRPNRRRSPVRTATGMDLDVECALVGRQDQAADLTVSRGVAVLELLRNGDGGRCRPRRFGLRESVFQG